MMDKPVKLRFSRENMWTVAGFVQDSFETHQAEFVEVLGEETFGASFMAAYVTARQAIRGAVGGGLRRSAGRQVTARLYANLDALKPLLDKLDVRLGVLPATALTVPAKGFGLKTLRDRIEARDAEAVSRGLVKLLALITANRAALDGKGYNKTEYEQLLALQEAIDTDNAAQNEDLNTSIGATRVEDADYLALDQLLGQVLRAGRLLFKKDKAKRRQYEQAALNKRVTAGERPKDRPE